MVNGDKESATIGKNFLIRLFTKMYCLGYDFVTASDLTRTIDMVRKLELYEQTWIRI